MASQAIQAELSAAQAPASQPRRFLFNPVSDFLTFGGLSLLLLPLLMLLDGDRYRAAFLVGTTALAHFVNNPHFGSSYVLFYRGFARKAFTPAIGRTMQMRYLFAGLVAPMTLVAILAFGIVSRDLQLLGYCGNALALFVGWHYTKQGYGLLMVDCALKRRFFSEVDKKLLLVNAYAVWLGSWIYFNHTAAKSELWGIEYFAFGFPEWLAQGGVAIAAGSTVTTAWMLFKVWRTRGALPVNGVIAYGVSLYLWLAFVTINPLWLLLTPALHSLQYLAVVARFETNYATANFARAVPSTGSVLRRGKTRIAHLREFAIVSIVLGALGFWLAPLAMSAAMKQPQAALGAGVFLFAAWIFVNVHHYFMDNVMWRRDNPDSKQYLFA